MKQPTFFLDRDGTINVDRIRQYVNSPEEIQLIPGAGIAISKARQVGFKISVITNQAGVAKGITPAENLPKIHARLEALIAAEAKLPAFAFDDVQVCLHHPDEKCPCRKPGTASLEASIWRLGSDPARSFFVGDKLIDLECGSKLGLRTILVRTGHGRDSEQELIAQPELRKTFRVLCIAEDLGEAVERALTASAS